LKDIKKVLTTSTASTSHAVARVCVRRTALRYISPTSRSGFLLVVGGHLGYLLSCGYIA
jgi:hypothetical protein